MVHCYTDDNNTGGVYMNNCVDTKAYFILTVFDPIESSDVNEGYGGCFWNDGWTTSTAYSDGDLLYIYESIDEAESDDESTIEAFTNEMWANMYESESAYAYLEEYCVRLGSITFPDPIGFNTEPTIPTVTWTINNKEVQSLTINNKEVQSIVRVNDNVVLYVKSSNVEPVLSETITVNSVTFQQGKAGNMYMFNLTLENLDPTFYYIDNINGFRGVTHNNSTYTYDTGNFGYGPSTLPFTYVLYKGVESYHDGGDECARITITSTTPPYTS